MANIKISQLSPVMSIQDADVFPMTANGSNMTGKAAASTIKNYMIGNTSIAGIGDGTPTGAIKTLNDNMPGGPKDLGFGYGTCNTAAATLAKQVSLTDYKLVANGYVSILFVNDVPANSTLSINSKNAKSIYYHGSAITAGIINAGDVATFVYDGVNYNLVGVDNSITQIDNLKTNQGILSNLTTTAKSSLVAAINEVDANADLALSSIAPTEDGVTVSQGYAIGEEFYRGGVLYKAKAVITASTAWSSLVLDTDYEAADPVSSQIQALANYTNKNNSMIIIGSSVGHTPSASDNCIVDLINLIGNRYHHIYKATQGLAGFYGGGFLNLLQGITLESDDRAENVTNILVLGLGVDITAELNDVKAAITAFTTYASSHYPNAVVQCVPITVGTEPTRASGLITLYDALVDSMFDLKMLMMQDLFHIQAMNYVDYLDSTGHPTTAGAKFIAEAIASVLVNGSFKKSYTEANNDISSKTYSWWVGTPSMMAEAINMSNDMVFIAFTLNFTAADNFSLTTNILSNTLTQTSPKLKGPNNKVYAIIEGDLHDITNDVTIPVRMAIGYDNYNRYMYYIATRIGEIFSITQGHEYALRASGYIPFKFI